MAQSDRDYALTLRAHDKASAAIRAVGGNVKAMGSDVGNLIRSAKQLLAGFLAYKAVKGVIHGITGTFRGLIDTIKEGQEAAADSQLALERVGFVFQQINNETNQTDPGRIKQIGDAFVTVGGGARQAADGVEAFKQRVASAADRIQYLTGISDDLVTTGFANILSETKDVEQAFTLLDAAADASARTGKEFEAVYKALTLAAVTGEAGELAASLKNVGLASMSQQERVALLAKTFDGAAEAMSNMAKIAKASFQAEVIDLKKAFGTPDALKDIARGYTDLKDAMVALQGIGTIGDIGEEYASMFKRIGDAVKYFMEQLGSEEVAPKLAQLAEALGLTGEQTLDFHGSWFDQFASAVETTLLNTLHQLKTADISGLAEGIRAFRESVQDLADIGVDGLNSTIAAFGKLADAINAVDKAIRGLPKDTPGWLKLFFGGSDPTLDRISNYDWTFMDPQGKAAGGWVDGPGGPRDDRIPARLSAGEFVVNAASAERYAGLLEMINAGGIGFANGGNVPSYDELMAWTAANQWLTAPGQERGKRGGSMPRSASKDVPMLPLRIEPLTSDAFWNTVTAKLNDTEYLHNIARFIGGRVNLARRFPAIGSGTQGDTAFLTAQIERRMRSVLALAGDSWAGSGAERWARMASGGWAGGPPTAGKAPRSRAGWLRRGTMAGAGQPQFILQTVAADDRGVRSFGMRTDRIMRSERSRQYQPRRRSGWDDYRYEG